MSRLPTRTPSRTGAHRFHQPGRPSDRIAARASTADTATITRPAAADGRSVSGAVTRSEGGGAPYRSPELVGHRPRVAASEPDPAGVGVQASVETDVMGVQHVPEQAQAAGRAEDDQQGQALQPRRRREEFRHQHQRTMDSGADRRSTVPSSSA